jgi:hypothetical protein
MRSLIIVAACALAVAACNRGADLSHGGKITLKAADGTTATVSKQLPANLPDYAKVYPGAKVTASMANQRGGILAYEVAAPPEAVMAFYKSAAAQAGLSNQMDSWAYAAEKSGAHVIMFSDPNGSQRAMSASVKAEGDVTKVGLTYGGQ